MTNASLGWTQGQEIKCTKCGTTTTFPSVNFTELYGDVRLNFVKITSNYSCNCPKCGNEMEVDVEWWQRLFPYKAENEKTLYRVVPLWFENNCNGCSVDSLSKITDYTSNSFDFYDLRLDFTGTKELVEKLYKSTRDASLLSIKDELKEKSELNSIESAIPKLKKIIDSHEIVLKTPYMPKSTFKAR